MELSLYLSFCLASFLMALMPGPDNIFVITESIANGKRQGILIALGLNSGVLVHTLAAATGISLLLKESELAFRVVQYAGVIYLLYLAWQSYKAKESYQEGKSLNRKTPWQLFRTGITMNLLNPKVALFFIAFLPQFVGESALSPFMQMALMGISFMLIGFITFSGFALMADRLRQLFMSDGFMLKIKWSKIIVLVLLAGYLLLD